jgi:hypothetical protein
MSVFGWFFDFVIASGCGFFNMRRTKVTSRFRFLKKYTEPVCFVKRICASIALVIWYCEEPLLWVEPSWVLFSFENCWVEGSLYCSCLTLTRQLCGKSEYCPTMVREKQATWGLKF